MRHETSVLLGLAVITLTLAVTPAHAQTTAAGPYLATPAWDQKLQCDTLASCPRFIVLANWNSDAVLDRETGLVWERTPGAGTRSRFNAVIYCQERKTGGRMGWRLPKAEELFTVIEPSAIPNPLATSIPPVPALPAGHPFVNAGATFMSGSVLGAPFTATDGGFISVSIELGIIQTFSSNFTGYRTWCVRSAGGDGLAF